MFKIKEGRSSFWQWDLNQKIIINDPSCKEVHFCHENDENALPVRVYDLDGERIADVPNILLQSSDTIRAYIYIKTDSEKYTKKETWFTVISRPKPADYVYTETELYSVEEMVEEALQAAKESGDFKGEKGDKGDPGTTDHTSLTNRGQPDQHPISAITGLEEALANAGGGGGAYELPIATPETLGGVKPVAKTEGMTQNVGVDETGGLWTKPGEGGGSGGDGSLPKVFSTTLTEPTVSITLTELDGNPLNLSQWQIFMYVPNTFADYKTKVYMYPLGERISKVNYVWEAVVSDTTAANTILVQTVKDNFLKCLQSKYCGANNSHFMTYRPDGVTTNNIFITTYNGNQPLPVGTIVEVYGR